MVETSFVALQLGHSSLGNCGVRRYTAQVSEEETEAQARSLLSAGSLCGAVLLTRAIWVAWDELEGVGLEVPAARPVHSHLCEAGSQCYGNDKMLGAQKRGGGRNLQAAGAQRPKRAWAPRPHLQDRGHCCPRLEHPGAGLPGARPPFPARGWWWKRAELSQHQAGGWRKGPRPCSCLESW